MNQVLDRPKARERSTSRPGRHLERIIAIEERTGQTLRESVKMAIRQSGGNIDKAARELDVTPRTLYNWLSKLGLKFHRTVIFE